MSEYVVVDKEQLEADLTIVADSIREKSGTTEDLAFPLGMKEVVESIDTSKEEQEKTISITENGTTEVTPDEGKVLSKVTVNTNVASSGGSDDFVGIKYSDFDSQRGSPRVADASSLPDQTAQSNSLYGGYKGLFYNGNTSENGGWHSLLEEIYLPKLYRFDIDMFKSCARLKKVHGDFSDLQWVISGAFNDCKSLTEFPYMPKVTGIESNSFTFCMSLTEVKIYNTMTSFGNAFYGSTNITDIYVPWAEGEVANAPWGATNATIHYNTTYDENHNPIV